MGGRHEGGYMGAYVGEWVCIRACVAWLHLNFTACLCLSLDDTYIETIAARVDGLAASVLCLYHEPSRLKRARKMKSGAVGLGQC